MSGANAPRPGFGPGGLKSKPWLLITRSPFQFVGTVIWKKAPSFSPVIVVSASSAFGTISATAASRVRSVRVRMETPYEPVPGARMAQQFSACAGSDTSGPSPEAAANSPVSWDRIRTFQLVETLLVLADRPAARHDLRAAARLERGVEALAALVEALKVEPDLRIVGRELRGTLELRKRLRVVGHQREQTPEMGARHRVVRVGRHGLLQRLERDRQIAVLPGLEARRVERARRLARLVVRSRRVCLRHLDRAGHLLAR